METTPIKMFNWYADDCGNNDEYCYHYSYHSIFCVDEGKSSSITEEELIKRFTEKSMYVLDYYKENCRGKILWKLIKIKEGEYKIDVWDKSTYGKEYYSSNSRTLTKLSFTTENVFHLYEMIAHTKWEPTTE
jgi:hypothetical protein